MDESGSLRIMCHASLSLWTLQVNEIKKQLGTANSELKVFISAKLASTPALASLNDPVYVQLAAYAIIGAPLLLLFLPVLLWLATCIAPTSKVLIAHSTH